MLELTLLLGGGFGAGVFGALLGLGGGVLIVPLLSLAFGLPVREAVGVSLVCVIVTSSAAAAVYLDRQVANLRLGMTLEIFTATAATVGGLVAFMIPDRAIALLFAVLLAYVAVTMGRAARSTGRPGTEEGSVPALDDQADERPLPLEAAANPPEARGFIDRLSGPGYRVHHLGLGIAGSLFAGVVSAILGIGGGIVKVPVMNLLMGVPLRTAAATSNLMIGVTASAGGLVYLFRGGIDPYVAAPTAAGVFVGASITSRLAHRVDVRALRLLFVVVLAVTAAQMLLKGLA